MAWFTGIVCLSPRLFYGMQIDCIHAPYVCIMEQQHIVKLRLQGREQLRNLLIYIASQEMLIHYSEMLVLKKEERDMSGLGSWQVELFLQSLGGDVIKALYELSSYSIHPTEHGIKLCFTGIM